MSFALDELYQVQIPTNLTPWNPHSRPQSKTEEHKANLNDVLDVRRKGFVFYEISLSDRCATYQDCSKVAHCYSSGMHGIYCNSDTWSLYNCTIGMDTSSCRYNRDNNYIMSVFRLIIIPILRS